MRAKAQSDRPKTGRSRTDDRRHGRPHLSRTAHMGRQDRHVLRPRPGIRFRGNPPQLHCGCPNRACWPAPTARTPVGATSLLSLYPTRGMTLDRAGKHRTAQAGIPTEIVDRHRGARRYRKVWADKTGMAAGTSRRGRAHRNCPLPCREASTCQGITCPARTLIRT